MRNGCVAHYINVSINYVFPAPLRLLYHVFLIAVSNLRIKCLSLFYKGIKTTYLLLY